MQTPVPIPTDTETLFGGAKLTVTFLQPEQAPEEVFVRQLSINDYPKLLDRLADEQALVDLYCAKPEGWARSLSPASHNAVMTEAERLNADFFEPWARRTIARLKLLKPDFIESAMNGAGQPSLRLSPRQRSSAD